jgi:hypothetical protein
MFSKIELASIEKDSVQKVAKGAAYLDGIRPGWRDVINLDTLNIASCEQCIIGQLDGAYIKNEEKYFSLPEQAEELGFAIRVPELLKEGYEILTKAWKEEILSSRQKAA